MSQESDSIGQNIQFQRCSVGLEQKVRELSPNYKHGCFSEKAPSLMTSESFSLVTFCEVESSTNHDGGVASESQWACLSVGSSLTTASLIYYRFIGV